MDWIKKIVGKLTAPAEIFIHVFDGEVSHWKESYGILTYNDETDQYIVNCSYEYSYVEIEQNFFGVWKEKDTQWGRFESLKKLEA